MPRWRQGRRSPTCRHWPRPDIARTPASPRVWWTLRQWPRESNGVSAIRSALADGGGYRLSKEAIILYGMANVVVLGAKGIRINCTAPGVTDTPILDQLRTAYGPEFLEAFSTPLGRAAEPDEQASVLGVPEQPGRQLHHWAGALGGRRHDRRDGPRRISGAAMTRRTGEASNGHHERLSARRRRRPQLGTVGRRRRTRHSELHHGREDPAGGRPGQARQGLSARGGLRLVGTAGRLPLPAEPAARDDHRRR